MAKRYLLVMADEDGNPLNWVEPKLMGDVEELKEYYGVKKFVDEIDDSDPSYWKDGKAMLLEVSLVKVKPVDVVTQWVLETDA